jgi:hypothetical protein
MGGGIRPTAVLLGAQDRASPNFTGLVSLALNIGVFCDFLYSILLFNAILVLDLLGLALSRPQVLLRPPPGRDLHLAPRPDGQVG